MPQNGTAFREMSTSAMDRLAGLGARAAAAFPGLGRAGAFLLQVLRKYHQDDCFT